MEELLNRIHDFVEGQKLADSTGSLTEFWRMCAGYRPDNEKETITAWPLWHVYLAKGLEFPLSISWAWKEDLFQSAVSMNTRARQEEERRLFYVAPYPLKKQAFLYL